MSAHDEARDRFLAELASADGALRAGESGFVSKLRDEARESFAAQGLPHTRLEEWRYTSLASLAKARFEAAPAGAPATRDEIEAVATPVFACSAFVFVDGSFRPELSAPAALSGDVRVESLRVLRREAPERLEGALGRRAAHKQHAFAALNTAFLDDGAVLRVPEGIDVEQPIHLVFATSRAGAPAAVHPRVLVSVGAGSRVTVLQDHVSLAPGAGLTNAVCEVRVARNASLDLAILQREAGERFHVSNVEVEVERDARCATHTVTLGGALVRNDLAALLADEGADCTLNGLFVGRESQLIDNHTVVDHAMPHGTSRELYKGILADRARGVFRGRVIVRPDAQKTSAEQSNPNLLLADGAEIDTKPQLEIHADDVRCSHGSSIGQLDEDALFYLRSRGIGERGARALLTRAFGQEVLDGLPVAALAEDLGEALAARLRGAAAPEETS